MSYEGLFVKFNPNKGGRPPKYTPEQLLEKFKEYVADRAAHPIYEEESENGKTGQTQFNREKAKVHPQLLSILDFCVWLGMSRKWWESLSGRFAGVKAQIKDYIEDYQIKGANAGFFNANIISRLLGLTEKQQITANVEYKVVVGDKKEAEKIASINKLG